MKNLDKNPPYNLPTYPPTWMDTDSNGSALWVVYDGREGFQPAYALVFADNADDAVEIAQAIAYPDKTEYNSETLRCVKIREVGAVPVENGAGR